MYQNQIEQKRGGKPKEGIVKTTRTNGIIKREQKIAIIQRKMHIARQLVNSFTTRA